MLSLPKGCPHTALSLPRKAGLTHSLRPLAQTPCPPEGGGSPSGPSAVRCENGQELCPPSQGSEEPRGWKKGQRD